MTRIIHRLARLFIAAACLGELALPAGTLPLSENARKMDANGNGLIERREASGTTAEQFALIDENRDSVLSATTPPCRGTSRWCTRP